MTEDELKAIEARCDEATKGPWEEKWMPIPDCPGYDQEVAHLNGDKLDNRLENLKYCTHKENEQHKIKHGTNGAGERNASAKLQGWQVSEIKYLADKSVPQGKIADLFGISHKHVSEILSGQTWGNVEARTEVPALIAEVRRLREVLEYYADEMSYIHIPPHSPTDPTCPNRGEWKEYINEHSEPFSICLCNSDGCGDLARAALSGMDFTALIKSASAVYENAKNEYENSDREYWEIG